MSGSVPLAVVCTKHACTPHTSRSFFSWCWQVHCVWRIWLKAFCALSEPAARPVRAVVGEKEKERLQPAHSVACLHPHHPPRPVLYLPAHSIDWVIASFASRHWRALHSSSLLGSGRIGTGTKAVGLGPSYPTRTRSITRSASLVSRTVTDLLIRP